MFCDRRRKKREDLRTVAEYTTLRIPKGLVFKGPSNIVKAPLLDISIGGCALESSYDVPDRVTLRIRIDPLLFAIGTFERRKEPLEMTGKVTSSVKDGHGHYRLGICFMRIKKKDAGLIRRFIRSKERRNFPRFSFSR